MVARYSFDKTTVEEKQKICVFAPAFCIGESERVRLAKASQSLASKSLAARQVKQAKEFSEEIQKLTVNLEKLNTAVELLISQPFFSQTTERLSEEINQTEEPFVWSVVDLPTIACELPENIRSCWIFVLKKDVPSGCHFHPNSIQHMVMLSGEGRSKVAAEEKRLKQFAASGDSLTESWVVIPEGVPHEFFPERENMVVVSFHTCAANELEEISCDTGEKRLYEGEN